ncbi:hypothetical protein AK812_SmicGene21229 [Symbiodinium microadriaticum]|uniref:Uncharacterized protein n=1 Tax=Symbiodinium microadriaticum TaxID=2951 RepID=A0A1Q9DMY9_SYMMI|nr:hypothetical protein AK812_SmicGene21229 [Symbiodinium microadriaticum]
MPADHSCGFHGIGIDRRTAAALLLQSLGDPEVKDFLASDLLAAIQTGERSSFPRELRHDTDLWTHLADYYRWQEALDHRRREATSFLQDVGASAVVQGAVERLGLVEALRLFFNELKDKAASLPSGREKLLAFQLLAQCKSQEKEAAATAAATAQALERLRQQCVRCISAPGMSHGSEVTTPSGFRFFVVAEAQSILAVAGLTIRVWAEGHQAPLLSLLHEARFGSRLVNLWYQSELGHFDRLVPCTGFCELPAELVEYLDLGAMGESGEEVHAGELQPGPELLSCLRAVQQANAVLRSACVAVEREVAVTERPGQDFSAAWDTYQRNLLRGLGNREAHQRATSLNLQIM